VTFFRLISLFVYLFGISYAVDSLPVVLVSVAAYQDIVQEMAGNEIRVQSVVPAGVSFHTFEPTPGHVLSLSTATLWLTIGMPIEKTVLRALQSAGKLPVVVDLRAGLTLIRDTECHCSEGGADTHIWTSPRMMKAQLTTIRDALISIFPTKKEGFDSRHLALQQRMDELIAYTDEKLSKETGKIIVIAHGAYDYLCRDYGIRQRALETGGKEATARSLHTLILEAKDKGVKTVFSLKQYPRKGIERVAEALDAKVIELDAYQPGYFAGIRYTAEALHLALEEEIQ
jgi:zinc transport system substrate-binding protein